MPKKRKVDKRKVFVRLLIICEGEKTEPHYFNGFLSEYDFPGDMAEVKVVHTRENTLRELVTCAKRLRESERDQMWVVADKDGYTKHAEAFNKARDNNINIAFSSISFEFWILLHYEYTTRAFAKADDIISYLRKKHLEYEKKDRNLYFRIKDQTAKAVKHAKRVREYQAKANYSEKIFEWNPYTNVDELLKAVKDLHKGLLKKSSK